MRPRSEALRFGGAAGKSFGTWQLQDHAVEAQHHQLIASKDNCRALIAGFDYSLRLKTDIHKLVLLLLLLFSLLYSF